MTQRGSFVQRHVIHHMSAWPHRLAFLSALGAGQERRATAALHAIGEDPAVALSSAARHALDPAVRRTALRGLAKLGGAVAGSRAGGAGGGGGGGGPGLNRRMRALRWLAALEGAYPTEEVEAQLSSLTCFASAAADDGAGSLMATAAWRSAGGRSPAEPPCTILGLSWTVNANVDSNSKASTSRIGSDGPGFRPGYARVALDWLERWPEETLARVLLEAEACVSAAAAGAGGAAGTGGMAGTAGTTMMTTTSTSPTTPTSLSSPMSPSLPPPLPSPSPTPPLPPTLPPPPSPPPSPLPTVSSYKEPTALSTLTPLTPLTPLTKTERMDMFWDVLDLMSSDCVWSRNVQEDIGPELIFENYIKIRVDGMETPRLTEEEYTSLAKMAILSMMEHNLQRIATATAADPPCMRIEHISHLLPASYEAQNFNERLYSSWLEMTTMVQILVHAWAVGRLLPVAVTSITLVGDSEDPNVARRLHILATHEFCQPFVQAANIVESFMNGSIKLFEAVGSIMGLEIESLPFDAALGTVWANNRSEEKKRRKQELNEQALMMFECVEQDLLHDMRTVPRTP